MLPRPETMTLLRTTAALLAAVVVTAGATARAAAPTPGSSAAAPDVRPLAGVSPCALLEGLPGPRDPIRKLRSLSGAFRALDSAHDPKAYRAAQRRFFAVLAPIFAEAGRVFHPGGADAEVDPKRAQRFLSRYVFGPDALLRMGDEAFELRPELAAALALSACRAGERDDAVAVGRSAGGADNAALRAFAALLLLDAGRRDEATELVPTLGREGFLAPWIGAELAPDLEQRRLLHAEAARHVVTPDQQTALHEQTVRMKDATPTPPRPEDATPTAPHSEDATP